MLCRRIAKQSLQMYEKDQEAVEELLARVKENKKKRREERRKEQMKIELRKQVSLII